MKTYEHFKLTVDGQGIAVVTFDRPPVNAQNRESREELIDIFDTLSDRDDVRVVVLTNAGKVFSAGADIKERAGMAREAGDYIRHNRITREFFYAVTDCTKPVIAAVRGPAIGAGFALMASCDIMLASEDTFVSMPELDVGLAGGARMLMDLFGRSRTRAMYFTGGRYNAAELYRLGVIEACLPRDEVMPEAMKMAGIIAAKSPDAVQRVKRSLAVVAEMPARDGYRYEQTITADLAKTADTMEAQRAFVEKRKPVFSKG